MSRLTFNHSRDSVTVWVDDDLFSKTASRTIVSVISGLGALLLTWIYLNSIMENLPHAQ